MKIMIVNTYYYPEIYGGAEYSVKKLAESLVISGHDVMVLATSEEEAEEYIQGVHIFRIRPNVYYRACTPDKKKRIKKIERKILEIYNPWNKKIILKIIEMFSPEVIHTNGLYDFSTIVWEIARNKGIKVVHTIRDYFLCCPRITYNCDTKTGCDYRYKICKIYQSMLRRNTRWVDIVTAPSIVTLKEHTKLGYFKSSNQYVIPNATDLDYSEYKKNKKVQNMKNIDITRTLRFAYIGTLSEVKGVGWLIESFKRIPEELNAELWIAGKGELEPIIREMNSVEKVEFHGFLNEQDLGSFLKRIDILICPSLWKEPFGRVVLDAYKNSIPVIVTDCGALPSVVKNGKTGFVIDHNNTYALTDAMCHYIRNPETINEHRKNIEEILQEYTIEKQRDSFLKVYSEIST